MPLLRSRFRSRLGSRTEAGMIQNCPSCGTPLAERGLFCACCAVQVRCKECREFLERDARACIMCGTTVDTGAAIAMANDNTFQMNTLDLQEDTKSRSVRISFSDAAVSSIGETLNQLVLDKVTPRGPRPFKAPVTSTEAAVPLLPPANQDGQGDQVIDTQVAAAVTPIAGDAERIRNIFEADGEDLKLEEDRLKANTRLEYARRLTYLFIYAHELAGRKPISYGSVKKILEVSKVLNTNTRHELGRKMAVEIEGDSIRLKKVGREKAIQALNEILDSNHPDPGWTT